MLTVSSLYSCSEEIHPNCQVQIHNIFSTIIANIYVPAHGKRKPGGQRTSYITYIQRVLGYHEVDISADEIAKLAEDQCAWRNLVVACSAAKGWWWWWWSKIILSWFYLSHSFDFSASFKQLARTELKTCIHAKQIVKSIQI